MLPLQIEGDRTNRKVAYHLWNYDSSDLDAFSTISDWWYLWWTESELCGIVHQSLRLGSADWYEGENLNESFRDKGCWRSMSSNALASTDDPSAAVISTRHIIGRVLDCNFNAAFDHTEVGVWDPGWAFVLGGWLVCASMWRSVWCCRWQILHLWLDLHCCLKCPPPRQFMLLKMEVFSSWDNDLNFAHTYNGCFSVLQTTQMSVVLEVVMRDVTVLPCDFLMCWSFRGTFVCAMQDISEACARRSMKSSRSW
jgi:hypothetical protein